MEKELKLPQHKVNEYEYRPCDDMLPTDTSKQSATEQKLTQAQGSKCFRIKFAVIGVILFLLLVFGLFKLRDAMSPSVNTETVSHTEIAQYQQQIQELKEQLAIAQQVKAQPTILVSDPKTMAREDIFLRVDEIKSLWYKEFYENGSWYRNNSPPNDRLTSVPQQLAQRPKAISQIIAKFQELLESLTQYKHNFGDKESVTLDAEVFGTFKSSINGLDLVATASGYDDCDCLRAWTVTDIFRFKSLGQYIKPAPDQDITKLYKIFSARTLDYNLDDISLNDLRALSAELEKSF